MSEAGSLEYCLFSVATRFSSNLSYTLALVPGRQKKIPTILFVGPVLFLSTVISRAEQSFKTVLQTALVKRGVGVTFADRNVYIQREVTLAE